jgi:hypothetical protein
LGSGSFSPGIGTLTPEESKAKSSSTKEISSSYYIYIYTGGGYYRGYRLKRGIMGYRPFIDSPLDSIDIYILIEYDFMVDDRLVLLPILLDFYFLTWLNEPGGCFGGCGPKMCITRVWGGFWGV